MAAWRLARSLEKLREQINEAAPGRSISMDGTIGDSLHAKRTSDHNPDQGVVHAIDFTADKLAGVDIHAYARYLSQHPDRRIKYIISQGLIWNPSVSPNWRKSKGHDLHAHFSVLKKYRDDTSKWDLGPIGRRDTAAPPVIEYPKLSKGAAGPHVRDLQAWLDIPQDGVFGPITEIAVKEFQKAHKLPADGIVGPYTWRALEFDPVKRHKKVMKNITASVFGGISEVEKSAYPPFKRINETEMAVALPWRHKGERRLVKVTNRANGKSGVGANKDIGPWNVDDNYYDENRRPQAESGQCVDGPNKGRKTNRAGIDLSPALAKAIGIKGMGFIDWEYV